MWKILAGGYRNINSIKWYSQNDVTDFSNDRNKKKLDRGLCAKWSHAHNRGGVFVLRINQVGQYNNYMNLKPCMLMLFFENYNYLRK